MPVVSESTIRGRRIPVVTLALIGLNVTYFLIMVVAGVSLLEPTPEQAVRWGADFGPYTLGGQWWRIATSTFLHFGILHLALNMWALLNLGLLAELLFGRATFLMLYAVSAVGASLASLLVHPMVVSGGASGAIFGVAGAVIMGLFLTRESSALLTALRKSLRSLLSFVAWNLIGGLTIPGIDVMAHIGGLVAGAAFGAAVLLPAPGHGARRPVWIASVFALFAIALALGASGVKRADAARISAALSEPDTAMDTDLPPSVAATLSVPANPIPSGPAVDIPALERVVASFPDSIPASIDLASAYLNAARFTDAVVTLQQALSRAPGDTMVLTTLGTAYLGMHRFDDAVGAFRTAYERDSSSRDARYNLASAYLARAQATAASGDRARARADFQQVLRLRVDTALDRMAREGVRAASKP